jgi:hypothetical protein
MRILCVLSLALFSSFAAAAQGSGNKLADNIDTGRTIIAKLDHAAQDDPPPNFASSILVRTHNDAVNFINLADSVSASVRRGNDPDATSMFMLYSQFINLFDQFDFYTTAEARPLALDKVRSVSMSKEYSETKSYFEVATYALVMRAEDELKACHSAKSH